MVTDKIPAQHIGRKIERVRTLKGIKQETLAAKIGLSQSTLSKLEQSVDIDDEKLKLVAEALGVSMDTIRHFDEQAAMNIVSSTFNDNASINQNCTLVFNPLEKWIEAIEDNKKLYERLVHSEREKNELLETMLRNNGTIK